MLDTQQLLADRYELQQKLGRTGAGRQTWLANDRHTRDAVIVKLLAFNPQMQWDELKLFEREAQVLQSLHHPRIPKYRDSVSIDQQILWFGLVQDYIPGLSLQDILDRGEGFTEWQCRQLAIDLLQVLIYLHGLQPAVLHRDIKPSNIMRSEDDLIYLVDFGAVQDRATLTGVTFTVVGTCGYAPLEQFWGRAVPASDLYALGATLIHLVTGIAPVDLPQRDSRLQFGELANLSPFFTAWLEKMTEPALEKRFETAEEALQALKTEDVGLSRFCRRMDRPDRCLIQLHRSGRSLRVHIPAPKGFHKLGIVAHIGGGGFILCIWLVMMTIAFSGLSGFALSAAMGGSLLYFLAFKANERVDLQFEGDRLTITYQSFRFTPKSRQEIRISEIVGVFLQKTHQQQYVILRLQPDSLPIDRLVRRRGHSQVGEYYKIDCNLTELESLWLVQEIQDWLAGGR